MEIFNIAMYILEIILLIILIILSLRCIIFVKTANNLLIDLQKKLNSINYIFDGIDKVSLFILNTANYINNFTNKIFRIRKD